MDTTPTPPDPDLQHLGDLLSFLPGPDDPYFWKNLPSEERTDYLLRTLVGKLQVLRKPDPRPGDIANLVKYLMMFFCSDTPAMHDHIGRQTNGVPYELMGRHWVGDFHATCWRLYVRYANHATGSRWETKWPEDFQEWYRQQRVDKEDA